MRKQFIKETDIKANKIYEGQIYQNEGYMTYEEARKAIEKNYKCCDKAIKKGAMTKTAIMKKDVIKNKVEKAIMTGVLPITFPLFKILKELMKEEQFAMLTTIVYKFYDKNFKKVCLYDLDYEYLKTIKEDDVEIFKNDYEHYNESSSAKVYDRNGYEITVNEDFVFCFCCFGVYYKNPRNMRDIKKVNLSRFGLLYNNTFYPIDEETKFVDFNIKVAQVTKKVEQRKIFNFAFSKAKFGQKEISPFQLELAKKMIIAYINTKKNKKYNNDLVKGKKRVSTPQLLVDNHQEGKWLQCYEEPWNLNIGLFREFTKGYSLITSDYASKAFDLQQTQMEYAIDESPDFFEEMMDKFNEDMIQQTTGKTIDELVGYETNIDDYDDIDLGGEDYEG